VQYQDELVIAERAATAAGAVIMAHYARGEIAVETKADSSPVTIADREANAAIVEILRAAYPADAILSEETPDDAARLAHRRVWIVDPLDGTRDFVARTGQFGVHVGFCVDGVAVVGAVYQPVAETLYAAASGGGAWRQRAGTRERLQVSAEARLDALRIGVSRLNASSALGRCLASASLAARAIAMGASTKHMAVAAGELDAVISLSTGEQEWDTCAPEVVVREAGGQLTDGDGRPFRYNQRDPMHYRGSLVSNGACHAALVQLVAPYVDSVATR